MGPLRRRRPVGLAGEFDGDSVARRVSPPSRCDDWDLIKGRTSPSGLRLGDGLEKSRVMVCRLRLDDFRGKHGKGGEVFRIRYGEAEVSDSPLEDITPMVWLRATCLG